MDGTAALVSVIVPTRDRPDMLRISLEAIGRQRGITPQIVVIDDGSNATHAALNKRLAHRFEHATYHYLDSAGGKGAGPAFARNVGIHLAQGRFVAFCDDDDYWVDDDRLAECVRLFDRDPELDFIFANQEVRHDGRVTNPRHTAVLPANLALDASSSGKSFLLSKDDCLLGWFAHMNTCVFRRELLERIGGFWGTACFEDLDLYVRAVDAARHVAYLHRTVAIHNNAESVRRDAITSTLLKKMDIQVCATNVAAHLMHTVRSRAAVRYARHFAGESYRLLAMSAHHTSDYANAAAFAQLGLSTRFSPKWLFMTLFYSVMALIGASATEKTKTPQSSGASAL
jgi:glycosyltransferase involved in cell wall biosynthesis